MAWPRRGRPEYIDRMERVLLRTCAVFDTIENDLMRVKILAKFASRSIHRTGPNPRRIVNVHENGYVLVGVVLFDRWRFARAASTIERCQILFINCSGAFTPALPSASPTIDSRSRPFSIDTRQVWYRHPFHRRFHIYDDQLCEPEVFVFRFGCWGSLGVRV